MEQTLGKRISALRKAKKMTQDQLADQLGVTAQAVSKWENDQSFPDITMLPRLAEIFGCTTDELLGIGQSQKVYEAEVVTGEDITKEDGLHITRGGFELKLDNDTRRGSIGIAVLILAVGGLLLLSHLLNWAVSFWSILWPTTLVVLGLFGTMPRSVFLRLGFVLFGGYFLLDNLEVLQFDLGWGFVLPVILLLFGASLLVKAFRKPKSIKFNRNGANSMNSYFQAEDDTFECDNSFGGGKHYVDLPRLSSGSINTSFGETTVDLSGVQEVSDDCKVEVNLSFGDCTILVPSRYRVDLVKNVSFATANLKGAPAPTCDGVIHIIANVSFGEVTVWYI